MKKIKFKTSEFKKAHSLLKEINALEPKMQALSDSELQNKTKEFKKKLLQNNYISDSLIIESFSVVREATNRVLKKRLYDVQILGGLILHFGLVAEMKTGEGKTIVSIAPVYLNALTGNNVMVATVNEYLAERDAEETGQVHNFLGLSVGINKRDSNSDSKREAYAADITYTTHSEIGFDYLRDNMVKNIEDKVQRGLNFVLIDEVDSILIDEARTPLIISGGQSSPSVFYTTADAFVKSLDTKDYVIDLETKSIQLTPEGMDKGNAFYKTDDIFALENAELIHRIQNALRANYIMKENADYIVKNNKIELIDVFTGRIMEGRSYSDGLQQAIQAKEKIEIEDEMKTMATITYQNLFRMFDKLSGMTGTAKTEEGEFIEIYNMRVIEIPTNKPIKRKDRPEDVYVSREAKYKAILKEIKRVNSTGRPILVGTSLVQQSERISEMLKKDNIKHKILNAKQDGKEAGIISLAGKKSAVTIATNMAGRGTDIQLENGVAELGGLYVLGTDKSESRRIDNQLRGRSGRQGDPGESKFFLSLDDTLISRFSSQEKLKKTFKSFGDSPISSKSMAKALERAQKKIEGFNFDARKNVLQFDDVIRQQRNIIYQQRDIMLSKDDLWDIIKKMLLRVVQDVVTFDQFLNEDKTLNYSELSNSLNLIWFENIEFKLEATFLSNLQPEELIDFIQKRLIESYKEIRKYGIDSTTDEHYKKYEKHIVLETIDANWEMHIDNMEKIRSSSSLYSYAQKNPFQVFTQKSIVLFDELIKRISHNAIRTLMRKRF